jgi:hypothetical protein
VGDLRHSGLCARSHPASAKFPDMDFWGEPLQDTEPTRYGGGADARGLVTYYVLFFIHLESRRVAIVGITVHPNEPWMKQIARNATMDGCGVLRDCRYLLLIGTIRRECVDHLILFGEAHLRRILREYAAYYNGSRTHRALNVFEI